MKNVKGVFQYASGAPVANGSVTFEAKAGANYLGTSVTGPPGEFETGLGNDGSFSLSMIASDEGVPLIPYTMTVYNSEGFVVSHQDNVNLSGASPISLTNVPQQNSGTAFPSQNVGGTSLKTIQGRFTFSDGTPVANGTATFTLSQNAVLDSGDTQIVPTPIVVTLDSNGNIPGGFQLYGNDALEPYTVYLLVVADANKNQVLKTSVSLSGLTPISINQLNPGQVPGVTEGSSIPGIYWAQYSWQKTVESLVVPTAWDFEGAPSFSSKNLWNAGVLQGGFECSASIGPKTAALARIASFKIVSNVLTVYVENFPGNSQFQVGSKVILTDLLDDSGTTISGGFLNNIPLVVASLNIGTLSSPGTFFTASFTHDDVLPVVTQFGNATVTFLDTAAITAWSITSNVVTFTAANDFVSGAPVLVSGLVAGSFLNNVALTVKSSGLSSSQFECDFTHANASATEYGQAQSNVLPDLTLNWTHPTLGAQTQVLISQTAAITEWFVTGNIAAGTAIVTFFAQNSYLPGQMVAISGLTVGSAFNGLVLPVLPTRTLPADTVANPDFPTGSQPIFSCLLPPGAYSAGPTTENGTAVALTPGGLTSLVFGDSTQPVGINEIEAGTNISISIGTEVGASMLYSVEVGLNYLGD